MANQNQNNNSDQGFGSMDDKNQRERGSQGGQNVPAEERSFSKDRHMARDAGRKEGENSSGGRRQ